MMDVPWHNELYTPKKEKRFEAVYDDGYAVYDNETRLLYHTESDYVAYRLAELMNEQQAEIEQLKDDVYDELDKALKVLEEIYEDYPKNNVHRLYNNLKGLKEMYNE